MFSSCFVMSLRTMLIIGPLRKRDKDGNMVRNPDVEVYVDDLSEYVGHPAYDRTYLGAVGPLRDRGDEGFVEKIK